MTLPTDRALEPEEMRAWLDRPAPPLEWTQSRREPVRPWMLWFDGERYLGEVSARTGPDWVEVQQKCGCSQCTGDSNV